MLIIEYAHLWHILNAQFLLGLHGFDFGLCVWMFLQGQDVYDDCVYLFGLLLGRVCVLSLVSIENDVGDAFPPPA